MTWIWGLIGVCVVTFLLAWAVCAAAARADEAMEIQYDSEIKDRDRRNGRKA